jgi:hypothetical protein
MSQTKSWTEFEHSFQRGRELIRGDMINILNFLTIKIFKMYKLKNVSGVFKVR